MEERDPQKVSVVLADPTRYNIYQYVLSATSPVNVSTVAKQFRLHNNVARMHLGKLVDIGLLAASTCKTGKGGRPGYLYGPSGNAITLTVPARDFQLLADLLVQSLALLGEGGKEAVAQIGRTFGRRLGREAVEAAGLGQQGRGPEELLGACASALHRLGLATRLVETEDGSVRLALRNCGFREMATAYPEHVCHMCKAMVEGVAQVCLEAQMEVRQAATLPRGHRECVYELHGVVPLE